MLSGSSSTAAAKTMQVFHSGSGMLNVVPVLLLVSFGFILGKIGNANFSLESYLPTFRHAESSITTTPARMQFEDFLAPRGGGLVHNMTDEELFWRASMEPRRAPHVSIVPKVAFLFLTQGALPLRPLWETFFNGRGEELYSIYVHASPGYADVAPRESVFHGRLIPSQVTSWGDMNLVDAELGRHEPGPAPGLPGRVRPPHRLRRRLLPRELLQQGAARPLLRRPQRQPRAVAQGVLVVRDGPPHRRGARRRAGARGAGNGRSPTWTGAPGARTPGASPGRTSRRSCSRG
ncbi:unnamed protein product [Alopecurus aequalis]